MGDHVLFRWRGYWMLGEEYGQPAIDGRRHRQLTVHTWETLGAARDWCQRQTDERGRSINASVELGGHLYPPRACAMLEELLNQPAGGSVTLGQIAHACGTSVAYARQTAEGWVRSGLAEWAGGASPADPKPKRTAWYAPLPLKLTEAGRRVAFGVLDE